MLKNRYHSVVATFLALAASTVSAAPKSATMLELD
jgi:hypothetical protein